VERDNDLDGSKSKAFADGANIAINQLMKESNRGAVLVGVAYLDDLLIRLFKARLRLTETLSEDLFESSGPLFTLSSRIKVAYSLGWIGPETFRDLNLLRKIRNDFAHLHIPITFEDPSVQSRCRELEMPKGFGPEPPAGALSMKRPKFSIA
jgi:DNA-binding MltR family transcriptional regulator